MTNSIKNYIEKNIETFDSNLILFFIEAAYDLGEYDMYELIDTLESVNIETEIYRKAALEYDISHIFQNWIDRGGERYPLDRLLNENLNNRLGFRIDEIIQYIIYNEDKFKDIEVEKLTGNFYVRKKGYTI